LSIHQLHKYPCSFCKKNAATQFCDFVIDYAWTSAKNEKRQMIGSHHITCDNQICKGCTTNHGGFEFCPSCEKLHQLIKEQHDRRKGRMMLDMVFDRYEQKE